MAITEISLTFMLCRSRIPRENEESTQSSRRRHGKPSQTQAHSPHRTLGGQRETGAVLLPQGVRLFAGGIRWTGNRGADRNLLRYVARQGQHGADLAFDAGSCGRGLHEKA